MNFKRIGRILVCLLLICCLTFHAMIPRAEASSIGAAAPIVKASTVTCNPYIIAGATLIALGVYAGVETGAFETVANNCVDALEAAGTWIKDGVTELLRTEDEDGNASYYVDSGLMEDVRSFLFESGIVSSGAPSFISSSEFIFNRYNFLASNYPYCVTWLYDSKVYFAYSDVLLIPTSFQLDTYISRNDGLKFYSFYIPIDSTSSSVISTTDKVNTFSSSLHWFGSGYPVFSSNYDLSLGTLPAQSSNLTDGTSARQWSEDYASKALMVDISGDDGGDYNLYFPMTLYPALEQLLASSQAEQWAGAASPGFTDYEEKEEYFIEELPIVDGYQGVIVSPSDTQSGTQSGTTTGAVTLPGWLSDGINNLLQGLKDILNTLLSLPAALWAALPAWLTEGVSNMVTGLRDILDAIKALPGAIAEAMADVITGALIKAFSISDTFVATKVEALTLKYPYLDTFLALGADLKAFFLGLGTTPPVIYINLGASEGSYYIGGQEVFMDLSWYARYKPTMDAVIGGFIWLWLAWRVYLAVPGIISGASGVWGTYNIQHERNLRAEEREQRQQYYTSRRKKE